MINFIIATCDILKLRNTCMQHITHRQNLHTGVVRRMHEQILPISTQQSSHVHPFTTTSTKHANCSSDPRSYYERFSATQLNGKLTTLVRLLQTDAQRVRIASNWVSTFLTVLPWLYSYWIIYPIFRTTWVFHRFSTKKIVSLVCPDQSSKAKTLWSSRV